MVNIRRQLGSEGEQLVGRYLEEQQFSIAAYNYALRWGEIDIIAVRGELLIFVEVKLRQRHYFHLSEVVGRDKQKKIIKTARAYIAYQRLQDRVYRFDVALLEKQESNYTLTYIANAFTAAEE